MWKIALREDPESRTTHNQQHVIRHLDALGFGVMFFLHRGANHDSCAAAANLERHATVRSNLSVLFPTTHNSNSLYDKKTSHRLIIFNPPPLTLPTKPPKHQTNETNHEIIIVVESYRRGSSACYSCLGATQYHVDSPHPIPTIFNGIAGSIPHN